MLRRCRLGAFGAIVAATVMSAGAAACSSFDTDAPATPLDDGATEGSAANEASSATDAADGSAPPECGSALALCDDFEGPLGALWTAEIDR